jgi:hypothetical protein
MSAKSNSNEGFALLEVLTAAGILTLILGALMSTVSAGSAQLIQTKEIIDRQIAGLSIQGLLGNVDHCAKSIRQIRVIEGKPVVQEPPSFSIPPGGDVAAIWSPEYYGIEAIMLNSKTPLLQNGKYYAQDLLVNMRIAPMQTGRKIEAYDPAQPSMTRNFVRFTHVVTAELCNPKVAGDCKVGNRDAIPWRIMFSSINEVLDDPFQPGTKRLFMAACGSIEHTDDTLLGSLKLLRVGAAESAKEVKVQFDATSDWVVPFGVTSIQVEAWGAGGSGASGKETHIATQPGEKYSGTGGGGGGGAKYKGTFQVSAGEVIRVIPGQGAAGAGLCKDGNSGDSTRLDLITGTTTSLLLEVKGGSGGALAGDTCGKGGNGGSADVIRFAERVMGIEEPLSGMRGQDGSCVLGVTAGIGGSAPDGGMGALTFYDPPQAPGGGSHGGGSMPAGQCSTTKAGAPGRVILTYKL